MREITLNGYIDEEVFWGDEITPTMLHSLLYDGVTDPTEDVHITLNSYGGDCNAAVRMHDDLTGYPGRVVITISGTAASAATVLVMGANTIEMTPGSLFMIHDPSVIAMGNERDLMDAINLLKAAKESIINVYLKRVRLSREEISRLMTETTWMDAYQACEYGFVDAVLKPNVYGIMNAASDRASAEKLVNSWLERRTKPKRNEEAIDVTVPAAAIESAKDQLVTIGTEPVASAQDVSEEPVESSTEEPPEAQQEEQPEEAPAEETAEAGDENAEDQGEEPEEEPKVSAQAYNTRLSLLSIQNI
ncbi:MAG: Clp protease ClpP [Lachnospiraceae bacterium]|nr:Clp protease ClpP [Lachnospiraceae bacterium]